MRRFPGLSPESQAICSRARLLRHGKLGKYAKGGDRNQARSGQAKRWGIKETEKPRGQCVQLTPEAGVTLSWQRAWGSVGVRVVCPFPASTTWSPSFTWKCDHYLAECRQDTICEGQLGSKFLIIPSKTQGFSLLAMGKSWKFYFLGWSVKYFG